MVTIKSKSTGFYLTKFISSAPHSSAIEDDLDMTFSLRVFARSALVPTTSIGIWFTSKLFWVVVIPTTKGHTAVPFL